MKTALITGIYGQDGSYLAELLIAKGYRVVGAVRDVEKGMDFLLPTLQKSVELVVWDIHEQLSASDILSRYEPQELYNLASHSSGTGMFDDPVSMGAVNGLGVTRLLEAIRHTGSKTRFCQASSREIYGEALISPQTEASLVNPRSPYGAAKLYADSMVRIYRQNYGLFACSAILFNHESPRRGLAFVTRKITHTAAKIKLRLTDQLLIGNLDAQRDWGFAGDYVRAMWLMLQQQVPDDYVVATGDTHTVRELCEVAFSHLDLDYRDYVREDKSAYRPAEPARLVGCSAKARSKLGWTPEVSFEALICMMVDADLKRLSEEI